MDDLISRQQAIDAIYGITAYKGTIPLGSAIFNINKIPAARPEPCEDAVSRKAAVAKVNEYASIWMEYTEGMSKNEIAQAALDSAKQTMNRILSELPPVTPKQRTGKWIRLDMHAHLADHKCTACEQECYVPTCMGEPMYAFCPNCGADMEETE